METPVDLEYNPDTLLGPLDTHEIHEFERWLHEGDYQKISFDRAYIGHLLRFHGGVPRKRYFTTASGTQQGIKRFLNFLSADSRHPLAASSVDSTWSLLSDRMGQRLMPFAELCAGDMLCFDHEHPGRPRVVVWFHEQSRPEQPPYTEYVASNFDEFLAMLKDTMPDLRG